MNSGLEKAIALLRRGDAESVEAALQGIQRTLFYFGIKLCGQREDAEDTAQEVLVKSLPHLAKLDEPRALSSWLYKAAKNRCFRNRKKSSYRREVALEDLMPSEAELSALRHDETGASPEVQALRSEDHRMLHQALLRLPPQYRIVLVLHDMEELDTSLVANILSLAPGTVRVRLHRARLMVRNEISNLLRGQPQKTADIKPLKASAACMEVFANLSDYLDRELTLESCEQIRSHIEACPTCVAFIHDLKLAIDRCRSLDICSNAEAPPPLRRLLTEEYLRLVKTRSNL
jgi:RNA polymerase sigma-70 factor (ECF subfamily)